MLKFVYNLHWHQLLYFSELKVVYHHEPYGGSLQHKVPDVHKAFLASKGPPNGWSLLSACVALQSCGWECGVLDHANPG
jgi:hypothetical protein